MTGLIYPSHGIIARAIVTACRIANAAPDKLFDEHPEGVVTGEYGSRARHYAFGALVELFPDCPSHKLSVWCGFKSNNYGTLSNHRGQTRKLKWWSDESLERVKAELGATSAVAPEQPKVSAAPSKMSRVEAGAAPRWTDDEKALLRQLWPDVSISTDEICKHVGHSLSAVKTKAQDLDVNRPRAPRAQQYKVAEPAKAAKPPKPSSAPIPAP